MASSDPFNFRTSFMVMPIPCIECGNNMHCVRRMPEAAGEKQLFICATCGQSSERVVGPQVSDEEVQRSAERDADLSAK